MKKNTNDVLLSSGRMIQNNSKIVINVLRAGCVLEQLMGYFIDMIYKPDSFFCKFLNDTFFS